ncbi:MAG TPA: glycosyltransferase family 39 protein [Candidatus Sulfomarinibacteraceae bacterium]|nr:glycosyltransferase family 39 protein [Candidatus Sulfomarinibacteraceae bacterium]
MTLKETRPAPAWSKMRWLQRGLLGLALLLAAANSVLNPQFEAPDELLHYQFVRHLLRERQLPVQRDDSLTQYHQPPLYYAGGALLAVAVEDSGHEPLRNPYWLSYKPGEVHRDNKAQFLPQETYAFPYESTSLVVHLLRLWSLLLLAGALWLFLGIARQLWPRDEARQTVFFALAALNPMLLYIGSSVNNDNMVILLGALLLWLLARAARDGFSWTLALLCGAVWGLAALSKITGMLFAAPLAVVLLWDAWRSGRWRRAVGHGLLMGLAALLLSGWWYLRNLRLYGELFAVEQMLDIWGERAAGEWNLPTVWAVGRYALDTFWGRFGYGQIVMPGFFYLLAALLTLLGLLGLLLGLRRVATHPREAQAGVWLALLAAAAAFIPAFLYFMWRNPSGANGRYIFPALPAFAACMAFGLHALPRRRLLSGATLFSLAAAALFALGWLVPWTYAPPPARPAGQLPRELDRSGALVWEPGMRLLGVAVQERDLSAQETPELALTGCWQADAAPDANYVFYAHVVDRDLNGLGRRDTHTGLGNFPTGLWPQGRVFCETYRVPLDNAPAAGPAIGDVVVGFYDAESGERLQARAPEGSPLELAVVDQVKVAAPPDSAPDEPPLAAFEEGLALQRYEWSARQVSAGQTVTLRVWWRAAGPTATSYSVFAHLLDENGEMLAQDDQLPLEGAYPTTFWGAQELIVDEYTFRLPAETAPGATFVHVGFYHLPDDRRLPRTGDPAEQGSAGLPDAVRLPGPMIQE